MASGGLVGLLLRFTSHRLCRIINRGINSTGVAQQEQ
jgi:hypothetical protein